MSDLLRPQLVPQQGLRALVIARVHQFDRLRLAPVHPRAQAPLLRDLGVQAQHVHLQRVELLGYLAPLDVLFQPHPQDRLAVPQRGKRRELLVQPSLLCQQLLDCLIFGIQWDMLH